MMWAHVRETDIFAILALYPRLQIGTDFEVSHNRERLCFLLLHDVKRYITVKLTKKTNKEGPTFFPKY